MNKNENYDIDITAMAHDGVGIGRVEGQVVFVPGAISGETVSAKILKVNTSKSYGKLLNVILPSKTRQLPPCPHYVKCGGCSLMHMSYQGELEFKRQKVQDSLLSVAGIDVQVPLTLGSDEGAEAYRNKAQFPVGGVAGDVKIGFYAPRSHNIVDISSCMIQNEVNNLLLPAFRQYMNMYKIEPYNEATHSGVVRHFYTRVAEATGEVMVVLVVTTADFAHSNELISFMQQPLEGTKYSLASVVLNINNKQTNVVMGDKNVILHGAPFINDAYGDADNRIKVEISPNSFYQVNVAQTAVLYSTARSFAKLTGTQRVFDLYCGIGTIAMYLAPHAAEVVGVEYVPAAVEDARKNAVANNIKNVSFHCGAAEEIVPQLAANKAHADVVVLDPPRKGCDADLLDTIVAMAPPRVVYVSCDSGTLARDLRHFLNNGYDLEQVQPVDMFPRTPHVEVVCALVKSR